jgi:hypothetical protein
MNRIVNSLFILSDAPTPQPQCESRSQCRARLDMASRKNYCYGPVAGISTQKYSIVYPWKSKN